MTITGSGFSSSSTVTIGGVTCTNPVVVNYSNITCMVPPSTVTTNTAVSVSVTSGSSSSTASSQFTYDVTNTPMITASSPSSITVAGGVLTLTGSNFGNTLPAVYIGTTRVSVQSATSTQIVAALPSLAPGLYSIRVNTVNGYARPLISIEYRFYVQSIVPQIGSLYGNNYVHVQGQGFDGTTSVSFTDGTTDVPCSVISYQADQIYCRTSAAAPRVIITATTSDSSGSTNAFWSPQTATVQQGAVVEWQWGFSELLWNLAYKVQQVSSAQSTTTVSGGFDSGNATASGKKLYYIKFCRIASVSWRRFFYQSISNYRYLLLLHCSNRFGRYDFYAGYY